jgi:hypothetical protein
MPGDRTMLSLDASHAILTCVLRFEDSGLRCRTPVRPVLLTGQTGTHRSDRSGAAAAPSSVLRSWLCGSTKEPSSFLVNHRKPRELGVASANRHSWLGSHVVPARPWFWGSTKKPSMTSSYCSCHHAARTWPRWPPGPSNEAYLSSPHLEASLAMTFRAYSSPAPTPVKPQLAPAILSQESVHTMLSITHHTRKRPSTGPRTTHGPQSFVDLCLCSEPAQVDIATFSCFNMAFLFTREHFLLCLNVYPNLELVWKCLLTVQNRAQVHRKPTGDLVPFQPRRVLPRFVNPRIGRKPLRFSI